MNSEKTINWSKGKLIKFSLILLLVFLLLIEFSFRIPSYISWSGYNTNLQVQGSPRIASDTNLIWNNRPFYLEYHKESQYNELGMRVKAGDVYMPKKQPNDLWVFLLGGSSMAGMGANMNGKWRAISGVENHPIAHSIDGYLQQILQEKYPNKNVRVFNAAITGSTILQSKWNYERLKKYKPDWIVSMDGVNEPKSIKPTETVKQLLTNDWKNDPSNKFPISFITSLTTKSAFLNTTKKFLFFNKQEWKKATYDTIRTKWINAEPQTLVYDREDENITAAVDTFMRTLESFKADLINDNQKHLLFIQPHLSIRNIHRIDSIERATFNYYTSLDYAPTNQYYQTLYRAAMDKYAEDSSIYHMVWVLQSRQRAFVDYCHFTKELNEKIAEKISKYILKKESVTP